MDSIMTAALDISRANHARRTRWQTVAALGMGLALCGILLGATGFSALLPIPTWGLAAGALMGLFLAAVAGMRLLSFRLSNGSGNDGSPMASGPWSDMSRALDRMRAGERLELHIPDNISEDQRLAFEKANEAFQFLARRENVVRAALDELRGELNNYYRYLTRSQVGLIGANSVAERLERFEERLAKIRSAV